MEDIVPHWRPRRATSARTRQASKHCQACGWINLLALSAGTIESLRRWLRRRYAENAEYRVHGRDARGTELDASYIEFLQFIAIRPSASRLFSKDSGGQNPACFAITYFY